MGSKKLPSGSGGAVLVIDHGFKASAVTFGPASTVASVGNEGVGACVQGFLTYRKSI